MSRAPWSTFLVLLACGGSVPTNEPDAHDEPGGDLVFVVAGSEDSVAGTPMPEACPWEIRDGELVSETWRGDESPRVRPVDLDGQPPVDLVALLGGCGNWGHCQHVVLRACGGDRFEAVWGPDYAQGVDVGRRAERAELAPLVVLGRTARAGCDLPIATVHTWSGEEWEAGEICVAGEGVWDEACGERPPSCGWLDRSAEQ